MTAIINQIDLNDLNGHHNKDKREVVVAALKKESEHMALQVEQLKLERERLSKDDTIDLRHKQEVAKIREDQRSNRYILYLIGFVATLIAFTVIVTQFGPEVLEFLK